MSENCLFCKIIAGEIPSARVYEDEICVAFNDISPQAPTHLLIIPREHFASLDEAADDVDGLGTIGLGIRVIWGRFAHRVGSSGWLTSGGCRGGRRAASTAAGPVSGVAAAIIPREKSRVKNLSVPSEFGIE